jgi:hypothetical protein
MSRRYSTGPSAGPWQTKQPPAPAKESIWCSTARRDERWRTNEHENREIHETVESRDSGSFPRPTQDRSKIGRLKENIKDLFGKLAELVTGKPTPSFAKRRKRREETGRSFQRTARRRFLRKPPRPPDPPPIFLRAPDALPPEMLDWMSPDYQDDPGADEDYQPTPDYPSLKL